MPDGKQDAIKLFNHFIGFKDEQVRGQLKQKYDITDDVLLDGYLACRQKYGLILKQANDIKLKLDELTAELSLEKVTEFTERWNSIHTLVTKDKYELFKKKMKAQTFTNSDRKNKNILSLLGLLGSNDDIEKMEKEVNHKLDKLFSQKYLTSQVELKQ
jgi:hypothetical protein